MDCTICLDVNIHVAKIKSLDCGHTICIECYNKLVRNLCPFCRQPFSSNRRSSLPISIPNSNNNELDDVQ